MAKYKFYEPAPKIEGTIEDAKLERLYDKINILLVDAETEASYVLPNIEYISDKYAEIKQLVYEVEKMETLDENIRYRVDELDWFLSDFFSDYEWDM